MKELKVKIYKPDVLESYSNAEYDAKEIKTLLKQGKISDDCYFWYPGMTEWKKISEFPFDNPPLLIPSFSFAERLDFLFSVSWLILNIFFVLLSDFLTNKGFQNYGINKNDYHTGVFILLIGYAIIYILFLSTVYLFTGRSMWGLKDDWTVAGVCIAFGTAIAYIHYLQL